MYRAMDWNTTTKSLLSMTYSSFKESKTKQNQPKTTMRATKKTARLLFHNDCFLIFNAFCWFFFFGYLNAIRLARFHQARAYNNGAHDKDKRQWPKESMQRRLHVRSTLTKGRDHICSVFCSTQHNNASVHACDRVGYKHTSLDGVHSYRHTNDGTHTYHTCMHDFPFGLFSPLCW